MSNAPSNPQTKVFYGTEETTAAIIAFLNNTHSTMSICADSTWPSVVMGIEIFKTQFHALKDRNVKSRFITNITKENLPYCKEVMQLGELRHMDGVKGGMGVTETEFMATAVLQEAQLLSQVIYSNVKEVIEQQQYLFEALWSKAIPASRRIREIEDGIQTETIELIHSPSKSLSMYKDLISEARREILVVIPTINAVRRQDRAGIFKLISEAARDRHVEVRILMPKHQSSKELSRRLKDDKNLTIRFFEQFEGSKSTFLIVDRSVSLVIELIDDSKERFEEAGGFSTYSTSTPGILSYVFVFENLWLQTELSKKLKESNEQLETANEQLELRDKMLNEFISVAAHEIRNRVAPILLTAEGIEGQEEDKERVEIILRNARRLQGLLQDVLDVTKIDNQTLKLNKEKFDLTELAEGLVNDAKRQSKNDRLQLLCEGSKGTTSAFADRGRIMQVLANLVGNAINYTKEGTISVSVKKEGSVFVVSVKDEGTGIAANIFPRLFSKFATGSSQGTGLGLYISKSIIEAHGGKIWAENNSNGRGATFTFTLPAQDLEIANK
ncbi:signal transduction histidine kinase [Candidatus Nitrososphaera evergladensis SR1]|jgi:two-component system sensor histidine kinase VicK|uniref:histidine kinase n=1 Tax=Candidatus Nitrososphaera evergladensis SR1 TaxID=1459636 RepID=A0A075MS00_9ARCH|nr:ATP-binding protein [Candidatus Nitrososphaera evergladensis]AIF83880.1 signal transduction histidine kinase [Candidatus Nitrososphaera evergladensis SR1]